MSTIEHLKKRAKQVLKWHHEGHWPIAEQLRTTLPEFDDFTDGEILSQPFRLADAQRFVAMRAGYDSWANLKLKLASSESSDTREPESRRLLSVQPCLFVGDIDAACQYYEEVLGFETSFKYGKPPFYGQVERDEVRLALRHVDAHLLDIYRTRRREEELLSASINVESAKTLFQEFIDSGATFFQGLRLEPWGSSSFIIEDPFGNLVAFFA